MQVSKVFFILILFSCISPVSAETVFIAGSTAEAECVVLLHGLARSAGSMKRLQRALSNEHFAVLNIDYPSTRFPIETLVDQYIKPVVEKECPPQSHAIHFVTHSMGGILVRYYLSHYQLPKLDRVVMISPPNQGSELVDTLGDFFIFKWLNGSAGAQLGTSKDSLPNQLGPVDFDLAVITGNRSFNPFYSYLISGDDDGKVAVERTQIDGMRAFKMVPRTHTFIVRNNTVIRLVIDYLKEGNFNGNADNLTGAL
ncbi:MAG: alpha/beta fold hydrolase [Gammaproteobacteria bacterium]|nr:alpha/beta fold hydrolase [Gammaproteobacteria bacterium]